MPDCSYIFVGDNLAYPYGEKDEDELNKRVWDVMERIVGQFNPDLAVVACNTASTVVLPLLRAKHTMPIVGVVPAIKPASRLSRTRHIGVLATPGTIKRVYTDKLIEQYASDCKVTKVGSSKLVTIAEDKLYGKAVDPMALISELQPFLMTDDCDIIVLSCTHFPLLNKEIMDIFKVNNRDVTLIDSGLGIANRVAFLIAQLAMETDMSGTSVALFTRDIEGESGLIDNLSLLGLSYAGLLEG